MATPQNQSVHRAFRLLCALQGGEASARELAAATGLSHATAHRFVATMEGVGAVQRGSNGRYRLGLLLQDLGRGVDRETLYADAAAGPLKALARAFGQTAHLGILRDGMVTYLAKEKGRRAISVPTKVNTELEAYCSGIGKVLLAHLPEDERESYLADDGFVRLTENTITDPARLRRELTRTRKQGFGLDNEEVMLNLTCIAVPVRDEQARVRAAISLSGDTAAMRRSGPPKLALDALRKTAVTISATLFRSPEGVI